MLAESMMYVQFCVKTGYDSESEFYTRTKKEGKGDRKTLKIMEFFRF